MTSKPSLYWWWPFHRNPARELANHGHRTRQDRERALYKQVHDELAATVGRSIPWARK